MNAPSGSLRPESGRSRGFVRAFGVTVPALREGVHVQRRRQVRRARELGWSWQQIAALLGVSKQAVHQKYGKGERRTRRRLR